MFPNPLLQHTLPSIDHDGSSNMYQIVASLVKAKIATSSLLATSLNCAAVAAQTEGYLPADLRDLIDRAIHQAAIRSSAHSEVCATCFDAFLCAPADLDPPLFQCRVWIYRSMISLLHRLASFHSPFEMSSCRNPMCNGLILVDCTKRDGCCEKRSSGQQNTVPFLRIVLCGYDLGKHPLFRDLSGSPADPSVT